VKTISNLSQGSLVSKVNLRANRERRHLSD
jgi:hypothetical protein